MPPDEDRLTFANSFLGRIFLHIHSVCDVHMKIIIRINDSSQLLLMLLLRILYGNIADIMIREKIRLANVNFRKK